MEMTWRQRQAERTKGQIVFSARRLFVDAGYAATTIEAIAADAGVSVPTVYKVFGNKRSIARELNGLIDAESAIGPMIDQAMSSEDPAEIIGLSVRIGRSLHERCGDIIALVHAASDAEPELASVVAEGMRRHVSGVRGAASRLRELGALKPGLTVEHAAGLLGQLTSAETFAALIDDHGWSPGDCEPRLTAAATELLLARV